jgi:putative ABC transport system ATP-binding protein
MDGWEELGTMKEKGEKGSKRKAKKVGGRDLVVDLQNVSKHYKMGETKVTALNKIDIDIEKGEFVAVMGPSGSGKSTLLNIIGCIDNPTYGKVLLGDRDVSKLKDKELTRIRLKEIGFVFQQFYLIPTLTAFENIELPMREAKVSRDDRRRKVLRLLEMVDLGERGRHYPNQLSGGEQQRVAIARALANDPILVLADEPTGELDSKTAGRITGFLRELNKSEGITVIIVTHDPKVAKETRRIITLQDGAVVDDSRP